MKQLIYVMDPMCSWCWAFSPVIEALKAHHPALPVKWLMGGLAEDSANPMPQGMQAKIQQIWQQIEEKTGTHFNHDFWTKNTPRRSTYPACRAVISAEMLQTGSGEKMAAAIQHAYYLQALNPSDDVTLCDLAEQLGFSRELFRNSLHSPEIEAELQQQIKLGRSLGAQGFPSLFLLKDEQIIPLTYGYCSASELENQLGRYL